MELATRSWPQAIAIVDCDSFYVSCELILNPKLIHKPVCVLSNNDGCVVSRSKEAKALGIKTGEPAFIAKKKFPNVIYLSSNYHHYGQTSEKIMSILREFTPDVEVYSIDEAFLDLTGVRQVFKKPYIEIAKDIRKEILRRLHIPVSIGVSLSKTLSKIAVRISKKNETSILSISGKELRGILSQVPITEVWQIGANTASLLKKFGINNAFKFALQDEKWVEKVLTKKGLELQQEICGYYVWKVNAIGEEVKGIQRTKSFAEHVQDKEIIRGSLHYHLHRALAELRAKNLKARNITIMLRKKDFQIVSLSCVVQPPSNFEFDFIDKINNLFNKIYEPNIFYRSSGIYLTNLISTYTEQLNLFGNPLANIKRASLGNTWDNIENQFGRQALKTASMPTLKYLDKRASFNKPLPEVW